jgi:hypothetical protein
LRSGLATGTALRGAPPLPAIETGPLQYASWPSQPPPRHQRALNITNSSLCIDQGASRSHCCAPCMGMARPLPAPKQCNRAEETPLPHRNQLLNSPALGFLLMRGGRGRRSLLACAELPQSAEHRQRPRHPSSSLAMTFVGTLSLFRCRVGSGLFAHACPKHHAQPSLAQW